MLKLIEGFEGYTETVNANIGTALIQQGWLLHTTYASSSTYQARDGHWGGWSLVLTSYNDYLRSPRLGTTNDTLIFGCSVKVAALRSNTNYKQLIFGTESSEGINIRIQSAGLLRVYRGTTLLGDSSTGLSADSWSYLEMKVRCHASAGTVEIRLNGTTVFTYSGNTDEPGSGYYDWVQVGGFYDSSYRMYFDDIYICDGSGDRNNNFLGVQRVVACFPNGAGSSTQWTPSAGSNYACVDEVAISAADYVSSTTEEAVDLYTHANVAGITGTIHGVQIKTLGVSTTDCVPWGIQNVCESGGTQSLSAEGHIENAAGSVVRTILEKDPNTDDTWSAANLNSAEFGVKLSSL